MSTSSVVSPSRPNTIEEWRKALDALPNPDERGKIPSFFFGHGQPMLIWPSTLPKPTGRLSDLYDAQGPYSPLALFLKDFGKTLMEKYKPKGIVVFSAHWETSGERLVSDYGDENPLLYDFYGFEKDLYKTTFKSKGSTALSQTIVRTFQSHSLPARLSPSTEPRGRDGRTGRPGPGFDHGVFVPFKLMFGDTLDVPVVQVSIDESLDMDANWRVGKALQSLRSQGILILSGGLTVHTFQDFSAFSETTAKPVFKAWHEALMKSVETPETERRASLIALKDQPGFRLAHPREEHFIPLYVAAGAGEDGETRTLASLYGAPAFAFGV